MTNEVYNKKNVENNPYVETFYIIPRHIRQLKGMTLAYLDVYETIFQFWNKGRICFLSNKMLAERTGHKDRQVRYALEYLEKQKVLSREYKDGKRYLTQPTLSVEIEEDTGVAPGCQGGGSAVPGGVAPECHINKEDINKEKNNINTIAHLDDLDESYPQSTYQETYYPPQPSEPECSEAAQTFELFWSLYPLKKSKKRAKEIWIKNKLHAKHKEILQALTKQTESDPQYMGDRYTPHPTTYLNQERWGDEIEKTINPAVKEGRWTFDKVMEA